ncbi:MAG: methyltransferase domain-containing protein [Rubripirellula sp.]
MSNTLDTENAVRERYSAAAQTREAELCCPVDYDAQYLAIIPQEVIDRDYGCGDPSKWVRPGETVLDLGSGGGKICFIATQVVGPEGKVIGVDMNDTMLELARQSQVEVADKLGYDNVHFHKGKIQDMAIDRDRVDAYLADHPIKNEADLQKFESMLHSLRKESPMIADNSIDVVVSNCVLNLVDPSEKEQLFREIFRVLKKGGRAVISDIVSDESVPQHLQDDPELWSGCISGAFQETEFLKAFERAGFYGCEMPVLQEQPWQTVEGIEFRSATVIAYKGKEGPCDDYNEAVIYRGPFSQVVDDGGHVFRRGERTAVCRNTFSLMTQAPYTDDFIPVPPHQAVKDADAKPMNCDGQERSPKVTKGKNYNLTILGDDCCDTEGCC